MKHADPGEAKSSKSPFGYTTATGYTTDTAATTTTRPTRRSWNTTGSGRPKVKCFELQEAMAEREYSKDETKARHAAALLVVAVMVAVAVVAAAAAAVAVAAAAVVVVGGGSGVGGGGRRRRRRRAGWRVRTLLGLGTRLH